MYDLDFHIHININLLLDSSSVNILSPGSVVLADSKSLQVANVNTVKINWPSLRRIIDHAHMQVYEDLKHSDIRILLELKKFWNEHAQESEKDKYCTWNSPRRLLTLLYIKLRIPHLYVVVIIKIQHLGVLIMIALI